MGRQALILAALAADAVPGKNFRHFQKPEGQTDLELLRLWDDRGGSYELKAPASPDGERELATEFSVLKVLRNFSSELPFEIPELLGQTTDADGIRISVFTLLGGSEPDLTKFGPGAFSKSFAHALAALHSLENAKVVEAGLPDYAATQILHNKVTELDRIADTGRVPSALLQRWEQALEDVGLFRFHPTITHGDISQESVLVEAQSLTGLTNWSSLSVSDPAEDFRWLIGAALQSTAEDTILNYRALRPQADENIAQRAVLYSELELGSWLAHCVEEGDPARIAQAEDLIEDLRTQLEAGSLRDIRASSFIGLNTISIPNQTPTQAVLAQEEPAAWNSEAEPSEALIADAELSDSESKTDPKSDELF
ncbi:phosphotransferase [Candidatus Aquiluna sp. UB-MaderosW2red]|uniref:phosphotransferase n=1 Tax=Candidatus Aquiluna sp. UB-MaderosW2red TaxID=1855377 RepID=UPI0012FA84A1|nr:phosphotransferase [Candidatus Aquiluna sp. UB-MaderosW2red]